MPHPSSRRAKEKKAQRAAARAAADQATTEEKRRQRQERREKDVLARVRRDRIRRLRNVVIGAVVVALAGLGVWTYIRPGAELDGVIRPPDQGGGHVEDATYDTPTPTSGPHSASSPRCGIFTSPLALPLAVHGLEHGAVVLWFDDDRPELLDTLREATSQWDSHVIISPNDQINSPVVATAWNRLKTYEADDPEITEFVDTYRRRGPERQPCDV